MSLHHNTRIVTDGLVFAYDMDNAAKSFKGKPTTNIITITDLDTGWSQGYNTSIQWNDYKPPQGVNSQVVSFIDADGNGSGYWYSYGDYAPQQPSTTYTISVYARTIGSDWSIRAYTADNSEVGRQYTNILTVPGDGKWHRLEFNSITTPSNTESDSLSFQFTTIPAGQRCWLCAPQMEEGSFATPFVNGTRSNTQALLDMSKSKNTITASSLTYNSDGTFEFDGTNDVITIPALDFPTEQTIEIWLKPLESDTARRNPYNQAYGGYGTWTHEPGGSINYYYGDGGGNALPYIGHTSSFSVNQNEIACVATTRNTSQSIWYKNGVAYNSYTHSFGELTSHTSTISIGDGYANPYMGNIYAVKLYNRALSAAEIKQNFNATRGRFGI